MKIRPKRIHLITSIKECRGQGRQAQILLSFTTPRARNFAIPITMQAYIPASHLKGPILRFNQAANFGNFEY